MELLGRILKYLFWLLIVSWSVALLQRVLAGMVGGARAEQDAAGSGAGSGEAESAVTARRLVRDPICGTHVAEVLAVPLRDAGELVHFCSVACRDKYLESTQRMAANG